MVFPLQALALWPFCYIALDAILRFLAHEIWPHTFLKQTLGLIKYRYAILLVLKLFAGIVWLALLVASATLTCAMSSSGSSSTDSEDYLDNGAKPGGDGEVTVHPGSPLPDPPLLPETINDTRFEKKPQVLFFICDRCGKRVQPPCVNMPVDGDYQARKIAIDNHTFRGRWKAGENFLWYCFACLAITEGKPVADVWAERGSSRQPYPRHL